MKSTFAMWLGALVLLWTFFLGPEIVAACKNSEFCRLGDRVLTQTGLQPTSDELATEIVPDVQHALERLYDTTARRDASTLRISSTEIAKLWFFQSLQDAAGEYFVVFGQIQDFEGGPGYLRCHACTELLDKLLIRN